MKTTTLSRLTSLSRLTLWGGIGAGLVGGLALAAPPAPGLSTALDAVGLIGVYNTAGPIDTTNPFFQSLGSNGRSCATCHVASQAMSFTPEFARQRYTASGGADPLFASFDGANCDSVAASDRQGHSLILRSGLIRIPLDVPADAEYSISVVHDPYGCALRVDPKTHVLTASVYRRPLPTANLNFLSAVMFDGRETNSPLASFVPAILAANLRADLAHQATDATKGHAQAANAPSAAQVNAIVDFELGLFAGQYSDRKAGLLNDGGAAGGPAKLASQLYYAGINDTLGADPNGIPFAPVSMTLYTAWEGNARRSEDSDDQRRQARADIAAGERIFNTAPMIITNVRGLNDNPDPALKSPVSFTGNCATCHDTPNIGNHSLPLPLDIGTAHTADANFESDPLVAEAVGELSMPDLPVFLISRCSNPFKGGQPESFYTTDPGKALISGKCSDFNRLKGPILRGLAARAPYFHNGAAANLHEAVNFYNKRFRMKLTEVQKAQLVAFLNTL
jgi:cytochrome c peroxidase